MTPSSSQQMKIDLSKYLDDWYKEDPARNIYPGPVVTISREAGCPAKTIASQLTDRLNTLKRAKSKEHPWRWISKEILQESARELKVDSSQIEHVFNYKSRGVLEDLLLAQSKDYYKSDLKIRTTIARVIQRFANEQRRCSDYPGYPKISAYISGSPAGVEGAEGCRETEYIHRTGQELCTQYR